VAALTSITTVERAEHPRAERKPEQSAKQAPVPVELLANPRLTATTALAPSYPRGAGRWLVAVRVLVARGNGGRSDLAATRREVPTSAVDPGYR
jgi:hypothetical protein